MGASLPRLPEADPIRERLEDQISWYDRKSLFNQRMFKRIKMIEILAAAVIPFIAAFNPPHIGWVTGALGVLITVLEGMLHLNQYQQNWIAYRSTCESLKMRNMFTCGTRRLIPALQTRTHCWRKE